MGLLDRLLVGHPVRPEGVGWVSEPGRRIDFRTVRRRQPEELGQTRQDTHPHADPTNTITSTRHTILAAYSMTRRRVPRNAGSAARS